eukprot:8374900-Pyramimonas_sp.AAC.1
MATTKEQNDELANQKHHHPLVIDTSTNLTYVSLDRLLTLALRIAGAVRLPGKAPAGGLAYQHHVLNALKKGRCFPGGSARCHQKVQHSIRQCTMCSHLAGNAEALDAHLISDYLEQIIRPDHYLTIDVGAASRRT